MIDLSHTAAIILAAGKGTRIGNHLPKVLYPIAGKPMISYILNTLKEVGIQDVFVVTGYRYEDVQASISKEALFVYQAEQLGTGHALHCALREIPSDIDTVIVLNGDDSAFYERKTLLRVLKSHAENKSAVSLLTAEVQDPSGLGRIIRDDGGHIVAIREEKEASSAEKMIKEVNIGCYIFNVDWSLRVLPKIKKSSSGEYYIGDTIQLAIEEGLIINSEHLSRSNEWVGVNTQQQLDTADKQMYQILAERYKPKVFIIDINNTVMHTTELKVEVTSRIDRINKILPKNISPIVTEKFWKMYESFKQKNGWISLPDFAGTIAEEMKVPDMTPAIKHLFYTLPFEKYLFTGARDTLTYLGKIGKRILVADGDLVYLPIMIKGMKIDTLIDDAFVYEHKRKHLGEIANLLSDYRQIIIDDQMTVLESYKNLNRQATTVWISDGPYKNEKPEQNTFQPDVVIKEFAELENIVREWT